jgi:predicted adenylyl cyclase CyaB
MTLPTRHNLELKARCADLALARQRVARLGVRSAGMEAQTDTYFRVPHGRLKLREITGQPAVLIWYDRPEDVAVRSSHYHLVPVPDPVLLRAALMAALGVRGEVRKRREILLYHNVRIHLDEVAGLGTFVEFEAVLTEGVTLEQSRQFLDELMHVLEIRPEDCVAGSYADLLRL